MPASAGRCVSPLGHHIPVLRSMAGSCSAEQLVRTFRGRVRFQRFNQPRWLSRQGAEAGNDARQDFEHAVDLLWGVVIPDR